MEDGFRVAMGVINVATSFERRSIISVVVDFAVVSDPHRAVFVRQRLMTTGQVNDAQSAMGENTVRVGIQAGAIRPAMREDVPHPQR